MNPSPRRSLIVAAGLCLAGGWLLAQPNSPGSRTPAQVERTQQRIDALLKLRMKPEPLPVTLPNPFQVVSGSATRSEGDAPVVPAETPVDTSADALARYVAKLQIGGLIRISGQPQLFINDAPRKEGDFLIVEQKDAVIYLQIMKITSSTVTFRLNEATLTVKF